LLANTRQFALDCCAANNALLLGRAGDGQSSLVKAVHGPCRESHDALRIV